jgi:hypothetical protein
MRGMLLIERRKYLNVPDGNKRSILNRVLGMRIENTGAGRMKSDIEIFINSTKKRKEIHGKMMKERILL